MPKIWPGQEDVKSRRRLIKGDRGRLLRNYVGMRRRREHAHWHMAGQIVDDFLTIYVPVFKMYVYYAFTV